MNGKWMEVITEYFRTNKDLYLEMVSTHIKISLIALLIATVIGIGGALLVSGNERAQKILSAVFQTFRVVPSLAVLILLIPIMGTGIMPALFALTLLAVPPIFMNTISGLTSASPFTIETAVGMGMTKRGTFWKVKWPLARPMILAGVKTAAIEIVASATLAAKIGAGGLGEIIFTGLGLYRMDLILIGAVSVATLSLMTGLILDGADKLLVPWK
ncbi:MAG: ABC transporter permease [Hespellia sp.]|nr:ABC transporter permease [Hespellia sp.]